MDYGERTVPKGKVTATVLRDDAQEAFAPLAVLSKRPLKVSQFKHKSFVL